MALRNLQTKDLDLNGYTIEGYSFNVVSSGRLPTDGITDITPLLPAMITKALGSGSEAVLDFGPGRYYIGANYSFPTSTLVKMQRGAHFVIPTGVTLTLPNIDAGVFQCFDLTGTGAVAFSTATESMPEWFGAKGDGVTYDNLAIRAALMSLKTHGGKLHFGPRSYFLTNDATGGAFGLFDLSGFTNVTLVGDNTNLLNSATNNISVFWARNCSDITFHGLNCVGDFSTNPLAAVGSGLVITDNAPSQGMTRRLKISDCKSSNLNGNLVRLGPNTFETEIIGNQMNGGLSFVEISGVDLIGDVRPVTHTIIANNTIIGVTTGGAVRSIQGTDTITGSDDIIDIFGGCHDLVITGNTFDIPGSTFSTTSCGANAILFLQGHSTNYGPISGILITGNTFRNFASDGGLTSLQSSGVLCWCYDGSPQIIDDVTIVANNFINCRNGVAIYQPMGQVSVETNRMTACLYSIYTMAAHEAKISNNTVKDASLAGQPVFLNGDRISCKHNKFNGAGYIILSSGADGVVEGNTFTGATVCPIFAAGATRTIIRGNSGTVAGGVVSIELLSGNTDAFLDNNTFVDASGHGVGPSDGGTHTHYLAPEMTVSAAPSVVGPTWYHQGRQLSNNSGSGPSGWICTVAGNPGTWLSLNGGSTGTTPNEIFVNDPDTNQTSLGTEEIVSQFAVDFDVLTGTNMGVGLSALDYSSSGSGTVKLRVGGAVVITMGISDSSYTPFSVSTTTTRPSGVQTVTVGLTSSGVGAVAGLEGTTISFSSM